MIPKIYFERFVFLLLLIIGFCGEVHSNEKSSLTFVIDDTGSMREDINQVKAGVDRIFNKVLNSKTSQVKDVVLVTFKDKDYHPFYSSKLRTITIDRDTFKKELAAIVVGGGGLYDCPEDSMSGILTGIENSQPRSTIYIYTDASAKDYRKYDEVKNLAIKKQCKLIFVLTGDCGYMDEKFTVYQKLADATSGFVFSNIYKNEISYITNLIIDNIESPKVDIATGKFPGGSGEVTFSIDADHMNATITVIGQHPSLVIFGPNSNDKKARTNVLIDINNVKTEQIEDTKPGVYKVHVHSDTETNVKVTAGTQVTFQHGFSTFKASSIKDTTTRPLPDVESYVHIQITDGRINLKTMRIIPTNGNIIENIKLDVTKENSNLYVTKLMELPDCRFRIEIIGRDPDTNKEIRRLGPPIEPQARVEPKPKPPVVDIIGKPTVVVDYSGNENLRCKIDAYPKPNVIWVLADGTKVDGQVFLVEKPYEYISYMKLSKVVTNGTYHCQASNVKNGRTYSDESEIQVSVRSPFTIISTPPEKISLKYGEKTDIVCNVQSPVPITIEWFYQNGTTGGYSKLLEINTSNMYTVSADRSRIHIKSANINHIGRYACTVSLQNNNRINKHFETDLKINNLKAPQILVSQSKVNLMVGQSLTESCRANGIPEPEITWQFKSLSSVALVPIPLKGGDLSNPKVSYATAGTYVCTATNPIGTVNQTIEVTVYGKPDIINAESEYKGVLGDLVLKIPCIVIGVPEPTITWKQADKPVLSDSKITVDKSALFIKNPTENDSNDFTCEAKNTHGFASKLFTARISNFIDIIDTKNKINDKDNGSAVYLKVGESADLRCRLPHSDPLSVRWYVNEAKDKLIGSTFSIHNAQYSNDGNYTCRVNTDQGSESLNTLVDIGYKPRFMELPQSLTILVDWNPSKHRKLDCLVRAKPREKFQWYYNGILQPFDEDLSEISATSWGVYQCKVSNPHGTIERTFNVTSSECVIKRKFDKSQNTPLLIGNTPSTWAELKKTEDFVFLNQKQTVNLACSTRTQSTNTFKTHPKSTRIIAQCDKEDQFTVGGKTYKFDDLQCKDSIQRDDILTKRPCAGHGVITEVGFQLNDGFLRLYDVCVEDKKTLYTKTVMSGTNSEDLTGKNNGDVKKCQYNKQPLVKPVNVAFGPAQITTLDKTNTVEVYEPCSNSSRVSWSIVEDTVRGLFSTEDTFILWSGASEYKNSIPRYLWEVVKYDNTLTAIVYVNDPKPDSSDIFCSTETDFSDALVELSDAYTYTCTLEDFVKKIKIPTSDFGIEVE